MLVRTRVPSTADVPHLFMQFHTVVLENHNVVLLSMRMIRMDIWSWWGYKKKNRRETKGTGLQWELMWGHQCLLWDLPSPLWDLQCLQWGLPCLQWDLLWGYNDIPAQLSFHALQKLRQSSMLRHLRHLTLRPEIVWNCWTNRSLNSKWKLRL